MRGHMVRKYADENKQRNQQFSNKYFTKDEAQETVSSSKNN